MVCKLGVTLALTGLTVHGGRKTVNIQCVIKFCDKCYERKILGYMKDNNLGGWALDEMWWLGKAPDGSLRASEASVGVGGKYARQRGQRNEGSMAGMK